MSKQTPRQKEAADREARKKKEQKLLADTKTSLEQEAEERKRKEGNRYDDDKIVTSVPLDAKKKVDQIKLKFLAPHKKQETSKHDSTKAQAVRRRIQEAIDKAKMPTTATKTHEKVTISAAKNKNVINVAESDVAINAELAKLSQASLVKGSLALKKLEAAERAKLAVFEKTSTSVRDTGTHAPKMQSPNKQSKDSPTFNTYLKELIHEVHEHPHILKHKDLPKGHEQKVTDMHNIATNVAENTKQLRDAPMFKKQGNENIWSVPDKIENFSGPIFMSRFKDGKVVLSSDDKPIYDVLVYENGNLKLDKSFIAPDSENSKASIPDKIRTEYVQIHTQAEEQKLKTTISAVSKQVGTAVQALGNDVPPPPPASTSQHSNGKSAKWVQSGANWVRQ